MLVSMVSIYGCDSMVQVYLLVFPFYQVLYYIFIYRGCGMSVKVYINPHPGQVTLHGERAGRL